MLVLMAVAVTRTDVPARELRAAAATAKDAKAARRMLAVALVLGGIGRKTAAKTCGMDRQTLRDRVHRDTAEGREGLSGCRSAGPAPRLGPAQKVEPARMLRKGPDLAADGVVRWRRVDLQRKTAADALPDHANGKPLEMWFPEFAMVPPPVQGPWRAHWSASRACSAASAPRVAAARARHAIPVRLGPAFAAPFPRTRSHRRAGQPNADTAAMNARVAGVSRTIAGGAQAVPVPDGAGWQGAQALKVPDTIRLMPLAPHAPRINPVGNLRACLRASRRAICVSETCGDIVARCCDARNFLANDIATLRSITGRDYAKAVRG
jgi:transposase